MPHEGAWERSLKYLINKPRTQKQMEEYLYKKGYDPVEIEETIGRLKEAKYINDFNYAENFARARSVTKHHGPHRLRRDLVKRGVERETVDKALNEFYEYTDLDEVLEKAVAKWVRINGIPEDTRSRKRLHDNLFRLGYEPGMIIDKISALGGEDEE